MQRVIPEQWPRHGVECCAVLTLLELLQWSPLFLPTVPDWLIQDMRYPSYRAHVGVLPLLDPPTPHLSMLLILGTFPRRILSTQAQLGHSQVLVTD